MSTPPTPSSSMHTKHSLVQLCLQAIAKHIWCFYTAKLLDDNKANRYHELFQVFDVALVERLRDDGEFVQAIMASLSRNRHARAYAKLLFDNKHILDAKDMAHFHLDFLQRRAEPSKEELQPMSPTEDEIDQTFSVEPRTLAFPLSLDENHKLESLVKQDVPLTNFGAHAISDLIRREDRLERLSLVSCQLGTAGMILLADAIAESKSLRVLDVSNPSWTNSKSHRNYITNSGIKALSLALQTNTSLEKARTVNQLDMIQGVDRARWESCRLQRWHCHGASDLGKMDKGSERCSTRIRRAAKALLDAFERSASLMDLDLEWCDLPPGMGMHLVRVREMKQEAATAKSHYNSRVSLS
ncbi:hypothetical protein Ae201684_000418 [Aphanomyces euteiches]|uniref:Uncharacterized protein n=1 Tax=Aphanomyces euteiches TaxID=100861 RepID=A0A6G0XY13_9STRA|nr:hypothetical protein Ae201684_000418 [Aphanomyces euteiches]